MRVDFLSENQAQWPTPKNRGDSKEVRISVRHNRESEASEFSIGHILFFCGTAVSTDDALMCL